MTKWIRYPSVTSGGKPWFWVANCGDANQFARVVWDREVRAYRATVDGRNSASLLGFYGTVGLAKRACQDWVWGG